VKSGSFKGKKTKRGNVMKKIESWDVRKSLETMGEETRDEGVRTRGRHRGLSAGKWID